MGQPPEFSLDVGAKLFDRYFIQGKLGYGGYGTVYRAHDDNSSQYAVKCEKSYRGFLYTEKRIYEDLQSQSPSSGACRFSRVHFFGTHQGHDVMVLDLFNRTLSQVLNEKGQFSITECKKIAKQAIVQLEIIHRAGWVHRDLKPANIMTSGQHEENLHIIDFGIAQKYRGDTVANHLTTENVFMGTPRYSSANVLSGLRCTRRDDLESLGYILGELRFGELPWSDIRGSTEEDRETILSEKKCYLSTFHCPEFRPLEMFFNHVKGLGFSNEPNYRYLSYCFGII